MAEFIVVGSGAAGVAAALELVRRGVRPLLLDVGHTNQAALPPVHGNLYDYRRRRDSFDLHIGPDLGGLASALRAEPGVAKLNAPNMAFVTSDAERLAPLEQTHFQAVQSFAAGGLGNAWGAGLYRWVDSDLADFPVALAQLQPYFDLLTREIGISGQDDDLTRFFGDPAGLLPPLTLSHNARLAHRQLPQATRCVTARRAASRLPARRGAVGSPRWPARLRLQQPGVLAGAALRLHPGRHPAEADQPRPDRLPARRAGAFVGRRRTAR